MKRHPRWTLQILERVSAFRHLAPSAAHHHERLDGRGYPWALDGERLDASARILAIADVYEALTADRPYRGSLPVAEVLGIMAPDRGLAFDGELLDIAAGLAEKGTFLEVASSGNDAITRLQRLSLHSGEVRMISAA
jgi:HD-GYP domain-containing protein (c-di-GMP phosphodiesterase class II)